MSELLRRVIRVDLSPMNPKVKCAQLECGHDAWVYRKPRSGAMIRCERCEHLAAKDGGQ